MMINALITSKNSPRVKMVIGIVKTISMGFTMAFSKDKTAATRMPVIAESMCTPGNIKEVIMTANVQMIN